MRPIAIRCHFCNSPADAQCGWLASHFQCLRYRDVLHGDTIKPTGANARYPSSTVKDIEADWGGMITLTVEVQNEHRRVNKYTIQEGDEVMILRPACCGIPVCELHLRRVGESKVYCCEHWNEWEKVV